MCDSENKYSVTISYQSKIIVTCGNPSLIPNMINFSTKSLHTLAKLAESYHILDLTNHSSIPCIYLIPYSLIEPSVTVLSRCNVLLYMSNDLDGGVLELEDMAVTVARIS